MRRLASLVALLMVTFTAWPQQRFVKTFSTLADLLATNPNDLHTVAVIKGYAAATDEDGNMFKYDPASAAATNATTVFKPNNFNGRWLSMGLGSFSNPTFGTNITFCDATGTNCVTYNWPLTNYVSGQFLTVITNGTNVWIVGTNLPVSTVVFDTIEELVATPIPLPGIGLLAYVRDPLRGGPLAFYPTSVDTTNRFDTYASTDGPGNWKRPPDPNVYPQHGVVTGGVVTNDTLVAALVLQSSRAVGKVVYSGTDEFLETDDVPLLDNNVLYAEDGAQYTGLVLSANGATNAAVYGGTFNAPVTDPSLAVFYLTNTVNTIIQGATFVGYSGATKVEVTTADSKSWSFNSDGFTLDQGPKGSGALQTWQNGGTNKLRLLWDGTFDPAIGGGATINSTDGFMPYRVNSTTFGDSPWFRIGAEQMGFDSTNFFFTVRRSSASMFFGESSGKVSTGAGNTGLGFLALQKLEGSVANTGIGYLALYNLTNGGYNTAVGWHALAGEVDVTPGSGNTAVGASAGFVQIGDYSTYLGFGAGIGSRGSFNLFLGAQANVASPGSLITNAIAIGRSAVVTNNNQVVIGNLTNYYTFPGTAASIFGGSIGIQNVPYVWPSAQGGASTVLENDGSGNLSWGTPAGSGITGSGTADKMPVWLSSSSQGDSALNYDGSLFWTDDAVPFSFGTNAMGTVFTGEPYLWQVKYPPITNSLYKSAYQFDASFADTGGGSTLRVFLRTTPSWTSTGDTEALLVDNSANSNGARGGLYGLQAAYGIETYSQRDLGSLVPGDRVGIAAFAAGDADTLLAVVGNAASLYSGQTNVAVAGVAETDLAGVHVGGYFELSTMDTPPNLETAVILGDNSNTGEPLMKLRANGTIVVSADGTGIFTAASYGNNLSAFAATTSAQLSGVLSDETGSGAGGLAMFSLNPSVTGGATVGGGVKFLEPQDNGTSSITLKGPNTNITSDKTQVLQDADGVIPLSGFAVTLAGPTAARTYTFPDAAATIARTDAGQTFTGIQGITNINFGTSTLVQDAANVLAVRNGATDQTLNVYSSYTNPSNYKRMALGLGASSIGLVGESAGTGGNWSVEIGSGANNTGALFFLVNADRKWKIDNTGAFLASTDNAVDIGASGANRPKDVYVTDDVVAGGDGTFGAALTGGTLAVGGGTVMTSVLSATATLDFGSILAAASADLTITVTGAAVGNSVHLGLPAAPDASVTFNGFVSSANTVTVRAFNIGAIAADPASATFRATVMKF